MFPEAYNRCSDHSGTERRSAEQACEVEGGARLRRRVPTKERRQEEQGGQAEVQGTRDVTCAMASRWRRRVVGQWRTKATLNTKCGLQSHGVGTPALLISLALGKVSESPFFVEDITALKKTIVEKLATHGLDLNREDDDRADVPRDFRFLDLLLRQHRILRSHWGLSQEE